MNPLANQKITLTALEFQASDDVLKTGSIYKDLCFFLFPPPSLPLIFIFNAIIFS